VIPVYTSMYTEALGYVIKCTEGLTAKERIGKFTHVLPFLRPVVYGVPRVPLLGYKLAPG